MNRSQPPWPAPRTLAAAASVGLRRARLPSVRCQPPSRPAPIRAPSAFVLTARAPARRSPVLRAPPLQPVPSASAAAPPFHRHRTSPYCRCAAPPSLRSNRRRPSLPQIQGWVRHRPTSGMATARYCHIGRSASEPRFFEVREVTYRPPGTEQNLLNGISLSLREKSFGLIFGRSGSGKTTLLQLLAGLSQPTSGSICIQKYNDRGNPCGLPELLTSQRVGIVFQFPERYFLADTVIEEVTFGWPRQKADLAFKEQLALNLQNAFNSVGLGTISLDEDPQSLSGGFKRRLALAIQLVQTPDLLLLDEPLAGLDWKARADVVNLLKDLKKHHTILVVSHDLRELYPLVDHSWRMEMGGSLKEEALPL